MTAPDALPAPTRPPERTRMHQRTLRLEGFRRDDGLWDVEGELLDLKDHDFEAGDGIRPAGAPIHRMWMRITVDRSLTIVDAEARMEARPYPGSCERITPDYRKLIGLKIAPGFTNAVRGLLGGKLGCVHLTEMVSHLATTAYQTLSSERHLLPADVKPPHLDTCHALDTRGEAVRLFYPRWYRPDPDRN